MTYRFLSNPYSRVILVAAILLAGCADDTEHTILPPSVPIAAQPDIVSVKLAQAADKAAQALDVIANIEQTKNPDVPKLEKSYDRAPENLSQPITVRWSGPVEQMIYVLANKAGYKMHVKGRVPEVPIVVHLDVYQKPLIHVMRDIGLQMGSRADLIVNQEKDYVEVIYAASDKSI